MARKLKYHAPNTDLRALERELSSSGDRGGTDDERPEEDQYSAYAERYNGDDGELREEDWLPPDKDEKLDPP